MKLNLFLFLTLLFSATQAQSTFYILDSNASITYHQSKTGAAPVTTREVKVSVVSLGSAASDVTLTFSISNLSNTAIGFNPSITIPVGGYTIDKDKFRNKPVTTIIPIQIALSATGKPGTVEYFDITLINATANGSNKVRVTISNDDAAEGKLKRLTPSIMYLNAANFDFKNDLKANYLGHLNWFKPSSFGNNKKKFGINTGVMKVNYSVNRTENPQYIIENVLLKPLDRIQPGTKFLKQFNSYSYEISNENWSPYFQLMYEPTDPEGENHLYIHLHAESLINRWKVINRKKTIQSDTLTIPDPPNELYRATLPDEIINSRTLVNGYFGIGITSYISFNETGNFFIQATAGVTTNTPQPASVNIETIDIRLRTDRVLEPTRSGEKQIVNDKASYFYLIRAYYNHKISESARAVFGTDMRGLFPKYSPLIAIYLGLNLDVEDVFKLLKKE